MNIPKNHNGHYQLTQEILNDITPTIAARFADALHNQIVRPGDTISLTYDLKVQDNGELIPIPHIVRATNPT